MNVKGAAHVARAAAAAGAVSHILGNRYIGEIDGTNWYVPAYLGPSGWIGVDLDDHTDWTEIAELLGKNVNSLKVRIHRARKALREVLDEPVADPVAAALQMARETGIGAQFGGKYFCHDAGSG